MAAGAAMILGGFAAPAAASPSLGAATNFSPPVIGGVANDGGTLHAHPGTWVGERPITFTYRWLGCFSAETPPELCSPIGDGPRHVVFGESDRYLRILAVAHAAGGETSATSAPVRITPLSELGPDILWVYDAVSAPVVSGEPRVGVPLEASEGLWLALPPALEYVYEWSRCDAAGVCSPFPVATAQTYVPSPLDEGARLRVTVTPVRPRLFHAVSALTTAVLPNSVASLRPAAILPLGLPELFNPWLDPPVSVEGQAEPDFGGGNTPITALGPSEMAAALTAARLAIAPKQPVPTSNVSPPPSVLRFRNPLNANDPAWYVASFNAFSESSEIIPFVGENLADPSSAVVRPYGTVAVDPPYAVPRNAHQCETTYGTNDETTSSIDANNRDTRFPNASAQLGDALWQIHTTSNFPNGAPVPRFYKINTPSSSLSLSGIVTASSTAEGVNPSISVSDAGYAFVTWSSVEPQQPAPCVGPQVRFSGLIPGFSNFGPGDHLRNSAGEPSASPVIRQENPSVPVNRWGDYSAVSIDPSTTSTGQCVTTGQPAHDRAWVINERVTGNPKIWGSRIGAIGYCN